MKIYLIKRSDGVFIPAYDSDHENSKKIHAGEMVSCEITRPRNIEFHKKFFALLNMGFDNQEFYDNFEDFRAVMILKAGFYHTIKTDKGIVYMPKSISFAKMDELEFEELYDKMIDVLIKELKITEEVLLDEIIGYM